MVDGFPSRLTAVWEREPGFQYSAGCSRPKSPEISDRASRVIESSALVPPPLVVSLGSLPKARLARSDVEA